VHALRPFQLLIFQVSVMRANGVGDEPTSITMHDAWLESRERWLGPCIESGPAAHLWEGCGVHCDTRRGWRGSALLHLPLVARTSAARCSWWSWCTAGV